MSTFTPSSYQRAVFDFVRDGRGSAIVEAVAGSGKTTTIIRALEHVDDTAHVQLFAFNTIIAKELKERVDALGRDLGRPFRNVRASTFHSVGFRAIGQRLGREKRIVMDGRKVMNILRNALPAPEIETYGAFVAKLVSYAKGAGIGVLAPDGLDVWYDLVAHHDLSLDTEDADEEYAIQLSRRALRKSNAECERGWLDFDDQLYAPLLWKLRLWQNDLVIIDEAQDTNPVRRALARLALKPGGRMIAVGDPNQAIYGFTGASHDALDLLRDAFNAVTLPLSVCYRCDASIIEKARAIVPHLGARDNAPVGIVEGRPLKEVVADLQLAAVDGEAAVLCRQTAPLIALAYQLIGRGVGARVLGRDIGSNLIGLIERQRARTIDGLIEKLEAYREREIARHEARGEETRAEAVADRVACVMTVIENLGETERTIGKLRARVEALFSDDAAGLTLSTVHKAKGREWDHVAILRPDLMPSRWARQAWQQAQEDNLRYVAWTRAKHRLTELTTETLEG